MKGGIGMAIVIEIPAKVSLKEKVEVMAKDINKSEHVSPLDACTCTGNCHTVKIN